jgi:hypothetical protein
MVVASDDNTEVHVSYPSGVSLSDEYFTLQRNQIFTKDLYYQSGKPKIDWTGARVLSTKPVGVYGGPGRAYSYASVSSLFQGFRMC